jgi:hypothetical protein
MMNGFRCIVAQVDRAAGFLSIGCLFLTCWGCDGSDLGTVSGTVTLDGEPLAGAQVVLMPQGDGSPSYGETDDQGRYSLTHTRGDSGALIGPHTVSISVEEEEEYDASGMDEGSIMEKPDKPNKVPARYNEETELTREVQAGDNTLDFPLTSGESSIFDPGSR